MSVKNKVQREGRDVPDPAMSGEKVLAKSRTGKVFSIYVDVENDGSLAIIAPDMHGYRSAVRDHAQAQFQGEALWCMNRLSWVNKSGARVVLTRWNTQAFRTTPTTMKGGRS